MKRFINNLIANINTYLLVICISIFITLLQVIFIFSYKIFGLKSESNFIIASFNGLNDFIYLIYVFILAIILAPLIETLIFQSFLYYAMVVKLKFKTTLYSLISATLFGCLHYKNNFYTIPLFIIVGLIINYTYIVLKDLFDNKKAYWSIVYIHLTVNLLGFLFKIISHTFVS